MLKKLLLLGLCVTGIANAQEGVTYDQLKVVVNEGEYWNITVSAISTPVWPDHFTGVRVRVDNVDKGGSRESGATANYNYVVSKPGTYFVEASCTWTNANPKVCAIAARKVSQAK